jgi:hypothetical protein
MPVLVDAAQLTGEIGGEILQRPGSGVELRRLAVEGIRPTREDLPATASRALGAPQGMCGGPVIPASVLQPTRE